MVPITSERPTAHREDVPDEILTEILARLPLRSISRFKTVCRRWKSAVESVYFRGLFVSVHQNSSCGWSLVCQGRELFNFHGCETWGLPKSIACYLEEMMADDGGVDLYLGAFSFSGLVLVKGANDGTYVGNPVLREWVVIPPLPYRYPCIPFGLVTPTDDKDGVVLGFKVVYLAAVGPYRDKSSTFVSPALLRLFF
ncbi:hypothetical protein Bca52824_093225 [Brassica carinata]|uniref:F-box domain-containing protein n=1 Tax=Brassica carinata TaxID=52824 RepID=A0A8X7P5I9_BRACI|nr:hypothetical protein Bca52824_093225 [Brassica carinata]